MDYSLFVSDWRRLQVALQAAGVPVRRDRDGALVTDAPLALVREIAAAAGVSIIQAWPPLPPLPADARPPRKLPNIPKGEPQ